MTGKVLLQFLTFGFLSNAIRILIKAYAFKLIKLYTQKIIQIAGTDKKILSSFVQEKKNRGLHTRTNKTSFDFNFIADLKKYLS